MLSIILVKCALRCKNAQFCPSKRRPSLTAPPHFLQVTHPLCMVMCLPCLGQALVCLILHLNGGKVSAWVRCSTLQNGENTVLYLPQHKTQPQHTTTNMSRHRPTLQPLWPSLSMATSAMDPNLGAAATYGTIQGAWHWVPSRRSSITRLGHQNGTHWKTERGTGS